MCADGELLAINMNDNADLFHAACLGLGALGIIVAVKLQCEPAFRLHQIQYGLPLTDVRKYLLCFAFEVKCLSALCLTVLILILIYSSISLTYTAGRNCSWYPEPLFLPQHSVKRKRMTRTPFTN